MLNFFASWVRVSECSQDTEEPMRLAKRRVEGDIPGVRACHHQGAMARGLGRNGHDLAADAVGDVSLRLVRSHQGTDVPAVAGIDL